MFQGPCKFEIGRPYSLHLQCWSGASRESQWGCPENFHFHRKIVSSFHQKMVLSVPLCSWKAHECFPPEKFSIFQPCGLTDSFGNPATYFPRIRNIQEVCSECNWVPWPSHVDEVFWQRSERHISLGPASRKVAFNPGHGFGGVMVSFAPRCAPHPRVWEREGRGKRSAKKKKSDEGQKAVFFVSQLFCVFAGRLGIVMNMLLCVIWPPASLQRPVLHQESQLDTHYTEKSPNKKSGSGIASTKNK